MWLMPRGAGKQDANVGTPAEREHALQLATPERRSDAWIDAYVVLERVAAGHFGPFKLSDPTKLAGKAGKAVGLTSISRQSKRFERCTGRIWQNVLPRMLAARQCARCLRSRQ